MAELDLSVVPALAPSPPAWIEAVLEDFTAFLQDHASAEKKASGMALNVASHYPDQPQLLSAMADLAVEELTHYREVIRILLARDVHPAPDSKDPYIHQLNRAIRKGPAEFLLDRLLIGAVVERRGAERFGIVAAHICEPALARFYRSITASEERHWELFVRLAEKHCDARGVLPRLIELTETEAGIMNNLPIRSALH